MLTRMSDTSAGGRQASRRTDTPGEGTPAAEGVLANLPRTRPQRSTVRREDARRAAALQTSEGAEPARADTTRTTRTARKRTPEKGKPAKTSASAAKAPVSAHKRAKKSTPKRLRDPAPRQGFESEGDLLSGPVQPPGGVDLLASAAELAGELTKSGLSAGGRLLKDVLSRLPLS